MGKLSEALDSFTAENLPGWSSHRAQNYYSVLRPFVQDFDDLRNIPDQQRIIDWLEGLTHIFSGQPLRPATKQDYYERIKALYHHAGLGDLGHHYFPRRQARNGHR